MATCRIIETVCSRSGERFREQDSKGRVHGLSHLCGKEGGLRRRGAATQERAYGNPWRDGPHRPSPHQPLRCGGSNRRALPLVHPHGVQRAAGGPRIRRAASSPDAAAVFAVEYLPGQFDQRADSASECIQLISQGERPTVRSAKVYILEGALSEADIDASSTMS